MDLSNWVRGAVLLVLAPALTGCCLEEVSGFGNSGGEEMRSSSSSTGSSTGSSSGGSATGGSSSGTSGGDACCTSIGQATAVGALGFQVNSAGFTPDFWQVDGGLQLAGAYIFLTSAVDFSCGNRPGSGLSISLQFSGASALGTYDVSNMAFYIEFSGGSDMIFPVQSGSATIDFASLGSLSGSYDVRIEIPDGGPGGELSGRFDLRACAQLDPCSITGC